MSLPGGRPVPPAPRLARRLAIVLFLLGVVGAIAIGSAFAAVDLWGGPRKLGVRPTTLGSAIVGCAALVIGSAVWWVSTFPRELRWKRALQGLLALALAGAAGGGGLFYYYAERRHVSAQLCAKVECAATRAERDRALDEGLGPLFPVIDPDYSCIALERERREFLESGQCPTVVLPDTPCTCGAERWAPGGGRGCPTGPTTCDMSGSSGMRRLGCAREEVQKRLSACAP